ncbi:MAG TPA: integrase [Clostridiales bacterium]|nr:integrase [Clostridiales bacterium]
MVGEILLNLQDVAELEDKSWEAINKSVRRGKINAIKIETNARCGFEYRVNLDELSDKAKAKYFARLKGNEQLAIPDIIDDNEVYNLEDLTAEQRDQAFYWEGVLKEYKSYIRDCFKNKTEKTEEFVNVFNAKNKTNLTVRTLYDKQKMYKKYGAAALADGRKAREKRGHKIDERVWSIFLQWWLDENQRSVSYVYTVLSRYVSDHEELSMLKLPSEPTFRRAVEELPKPVIKFFREGNKAFEDDCLPYIIRTYENIYSNDFWSSDYHTLDMMVRDDITGEVYRPHIVGWIDIRSRKILSMRLRKESDSDGVVLSFRDAALKYGLPSKVYLDNGREFLTYAFGGRGKRKDGSASNYGTNILDRIGVEMVNAIVKNAKAKVVERIFKQVTSEFAKLFITYCGNRPGNRPERHNKVLKNVDNIPYASEIKEELLAYVEGWYNLKSSKAEGLKGKCPNECYSSLLVNKRKITDDQANILLTRNERKQSVDRNGVYVKVGTEKVWFYDAEFVALYQGQKVYARFDPDELTSIRVYDEHEKFLTVLDRAAEGGYEGVADTEAMKKVNSDKKKVKTIVKNFIENKEKIMEAPEMRDVVINIARQNIENDNSTYDADILEGMFINENIDYKKAVGDVEVNFSKMIENAKKQKEKDGN